MNGDQLFNWLVKFQIEHNLPKVLPHIKDGKADFLTEGDIGYDHRTPYDIKRFLIVANGDTLVSKLADSEMISEPEKLVFNNIPEYQDFERYFNRHNGDGAYIAHLSNAKIARVMEISNGHPRNLASLYRRLPKHFISLDETVGVEESGNKTRLATRIPYLPNLMEDAVHTFQIKGTVHSKLGLGIVTHFNKESMEMFYFDYAPNNKGPYIVESKGIIGVHEKYQLRDSNYVLTEKKQIDLNEINF